MHSGRSVFSLLIISIFSAIALLPGCSGKPGASKMVLSYQASVNSQAVDSCLNLFSDDAEIWMPGESSPLTGKTSLRGLLEYDSTLNTRVDIVLLRVADDTAFCQVSETNDWLKEAGLPANLYPSKIIVVHDGKISRMSSELSDSSATGINGIMESLVPWAQENQPQMLDSLMSDGNFVYNAVSARITLGLLRVWKISNGQ